MKKKTHLWIAVIMVLIASALLFLPLVFAVDFDMGEMNSLQPTIRLTYSQPVKMDSLYPQVVPDSGQPLVMDTDFTFTPISSGDYSNEFDIAFTHPLAEGNYDVFMYAKNPSGYGTETVDHASFSIPGLQIFLQSPGYGYSNQLPFDVVIKTFYMEDPANVNCRYNWGSDKTYETMLNEFTEQGASSTHTIQGITDTIQRDLYVACIQGDGGEKHAHFTIGYDPTQPSIINATADPSEVVDPRKAFTTLYVKTDDKTVCSYGESEDSQRTFFPQEDVHNPSTFKKEHTVVMVYPPQEYGLSRKELSYNIECENMAGDSATADISVAVDYGAEFSINMISPDRYTSESDIVFSISPTVISTCSFADGSEFDSSQDGVYSKDMGELNEGDYSFSVSCTSDVNTVTKQLNFTVDRTPPSNLNVTVLSACGGELSLIATAQDLTGIKDFVYSVQSGGSVIAKGSSASGEFSINVSNVQDSNVKLTVQAEDLAGNPSDAFMQDIFMPGEDSPLCPESRFIYYKSPPLGFSNKPSFDIVVGTKRQALCRYGYGSKNTPFSALTPFQEDASNTYGTTHTIPKYSNFGDDNITTFVVKCKEQDDTMHSAYMTFGYDLTKPVISVSAEPNPVKDVMSKYTKLMVSSDDNVYCYYDDTPFNKSLSDQADIAYKKETSIIIEYSDILDFLPHTFQYNVVCKNLAQESSSKSYTVMVNFLNAFNISRLSPPRYTNNDDIDLVIKPETSVVKPCEYKNVNDSTYASFDSENDDGSFSTNLGVLDERDYQYSIKCTSPSAEQESLVEFTVDTTPPELIVSAQPEVCIGQDAELTFNLTELHMKDLAMQLTDINDGVVMNKILDYTKGQEVISFTGANLTEGDYSILLTAEDKANNSADAEAGITVYPADDPICDSILPFHCNNGVQDDNETGIDCGGECDACNPENLCNIDEDCGSGDSCVDGVCTPVGSCVVDEDCGSGDSCVDGVCTPVGSCVVDEDCGIGYSCVDGVCEPSKGSPPGFICTTSIGLEGEPLDANSDGDYTDNDDDYDGDGLLNSVDDDPCGEETPTSTEPPPKNKSSLFALILIILGLLLSGGSGYYLYDQHKRKPASPAFTGQMPGAYPSQEGKGTPEIPGLTRPPAPGRPASGSSKPLNIPPPQIQPRYSSAELKRIASRKRISELLEEKRKRLSVFDKEGEAGKEKKSSSSLKSTTKSKDKEKEDLWKSVASKPVEKSGESEAKESFVDIASLGKGNTGENIKSKAVEKEGRSKKKNIDKESSVFEELEKLAQKREK